MFYEVTWFRDVQTPVTVRPGAGVVCGCLCRRRVVPLMDAFFFKPFIAFIFSFIALLQGLTRGHCLGLVTRADSVTHWYLRKDDKAGS
jgi:hypothetical protein